MITYTEFKKQALFGFGDEDPYDFPIYEEYNNNGNFGLQQSENNYNTWKPYSTDFEYDDKFETDRKNLYTDNMTAKQKWETYQKQMEDQISDEVGITGWMGAKAMDASDWLHDHLPWTTPRSDPNGSNYDKIKDQALGSEGAQRTTDMFLRSLTPEDIAYYQKNKDKLTSGDSPLNKNLAGYQTYNKYVQNGMASQMWNAVKQDTFKYLPIAIGTFLRQVGANGLASFAENPVAFYGTLGSALFLGGASFLRGGGTTVNVNSEQKQNAGYNRIPYSVS